MIADSWLRERGLPLMAVPDYFAREALLDLRPITAKFRSSANSSVSMYHTNERKPTGHTVPVRTVVLCVGGRGAPMPGTEVRALGPYHRAPSTGGAGALSVPAPQVLESTCTFQHRAPSYSIFSTEKTLLASLLSTKLLKLVLII